MSIVDFPAGYSPARTVNLADDQGMEWVQMSDGSTQGRAVSTSRFTDSNIVLPYLTQTQMIEVTGFLYANRSNTIRWSFDGYTYEGNVTGAVNRTMVGNRYNVNFVYRAEVTDTNIIITTQPSNIDSIAPSADAVFTLVATAFQGELSYQWQRQNGDGSWSDIADSLDYSGTQTASLTVDSVSASDVGASFQCLIGNGFATVTSDAVQITAIDYASTLSIDTEPSNISSIVAGGNAEFTVVATSTSGAVSYQWQTYSGGSWSTISDGADYSGTTTATLTVSSVAVADEGVLYRCYVSNIDAGLVTAEVQIVSVGGQKYTMDGSTMHATIPAYAPPGLPWAFSLKFNAATVNATQKQIVGGNQVALFINASDQLAFNYLSPDGSLFDIVGPTVSALTDYTVGVVATGSGVTLTVGGTDYPNTQIAASVDQDEFTRIASNEVPGDRFDGEVWALSFDDNSVMAGESAVVHDGSRSLSIPVVRSDDVFIFECQYVREDNTGTGSVTVCQGDDPYGVGSTSTVVINDSGHASAPDDLIITDIDGNSVTFADALVNVGQGQRIKLAILIAQADAETGERAGSVTIDDAVAVEVADAGIGVVCVDTIGPLPTNGYINQLVLGQDERGASHSFVLTEGSGTSAANALDSKDFGYITNEQDQSSDLTGTEYTPPTGNAVLLFESDFETGTIQGSSAAVDGWGVQPSVIAPRATIVTSPVRKGNYACKLDLRRADYLQGGIAYDPSGYPTPRVQLMRPYTATPLNIGTEYWIGCSIMWESGWVTEEWDGTSSNNQELFWQIHGVGGTDGIGPISLDWSKNKFEWVVRHGNWASSPQKETFDMGAIVSGEYIDFIVRVILDTGSGGVFEVWRNGVKIITYSGPTYYYNGSVIPSDGGYFTATMYKAKYHQLSTPTNNTTRVLYYDAIRIVEGTGTDAYNMADPSQN